MMNKVILMGRLTKEVELKYTTNQKEVCNFSIAINRKFKNQEGNYEADFINCQAWGNTAKFVSQYFGKGDMIAIVGRMQTRNYEVEGVKKFITEVIVDEANFTGSKNTGGSANTGQVTSEQTEFVADDGTDDLPF